MNFFFPVVAVGVAEIVIRQKLQINLTWFNGLGGIVLFAFLENKCGKNIRKQDWRNIEEIQSSTQDMACESAPGGREKKNSVSIVYLSSFALVGRIFFQPHREPVPRLRKKQFAALSQQGRWRPLSYKL